MPKQIFNRSHFNVQITEIINAVYAADYNK